MHEIDLIPSEYRVRLLFVRWIKLSLFFVSCVATLIIGWFCFLSYLTQEAEIEVKTLQEKKAISTRQRDELERLDSRKKALQQQLRLLTGLRSSAAAEQMFLTIDRALVEDKLWFLNWKFLRAGTVVKPEQQTVNTGYFIVVPRGEKPLKSETWQIETHMTIKGQALDHSALSTFVSRLINQPEIQDVRVLRTALKHNRETRVVEFSLAVTVAGGAGNS